MSATTSGGGTGAALRVEGVSFAIGDLNILTNVDAQCAAGQVTGLVGPNGAGKTTLLNCISGLYRPTAGRVLIGDTELQKQLPHEVARSGIGRTFQTPQVVDDLTVMENVMLGAQIGSQRFIPDSLSILWRGARERGLETLAVESLERVRLQSFGSKLVSQCTHIERRLIELARALSAAPKALLLDEPCAGMAADGRELLAEIVTDLARGGMTILLVEHDVNFVTNVSDHVVVLDQGRIIANGPPNVVMADPVVIDAYLGR